jgi:hypothetical protein
MKFSLTPVLLLLVIVVVLVISLFINQKIPEGFSTYNYTDNETNKGQNYTILTYDGDKAVTKLYDNLYFDKSNRNFIEVVSNEYKESDFEGKSDTEKQSMLKAYTSINIIYNGSTTNTIQATTDGDSGAYEPNVADDRDSKKTFIDGSNKFYSFVTTLDHSKYVVCVHEHNEETLIHIVDPAPASPKHIITYLFNKNGLFEYKFLGALIIPSETSTPLETMETLSGTILPLYSSNKLLSEIVAGELYLDMSNYNLIKVSADSNLEVSTIDGVIFNITDSSSHDESLITKTTTLSENLVVKHLGAKPGIVAFTPSGAYCMMLDSTFNLGSSLYFKKTTSTETTGSTTTSETSSSATDTSGNFLTDYARFVDIYNQLNANGITLPSSASSNTSSDYILKTEIVPPVCPTCPSCAGDCNSVCATCGGNGGSGTTNANGVSLTGDSTSSRTTDENGNVIIRTIDSAGNAIIKIIDSTGNIVVKTIDTTGEVIEKTVDSTGTALNKIGTSVETVSKDIYNTTGNVVSTVGNTAQRVGTDLYDGAGNLISTAGSTAQTVGGDVYGGAKTVGGDVYDAAGNIVSGAGTAVSTVGQGISTVAQDLYGGIKNLGSGATQPGQHNQMNTSYGRSSYGGPGGSSYGAPAQGDVNVPQFGPDSRVSYENSVSNYDYYGALPAKPSNYVARTSDFSAFGK